MWEFLTLMTFVGGIVAFGGPPTGHAAYSSSLLKPSPLASPSFNISGDLFVKDGKPYRILSGEIHFWRMSPVDWEARLAAVAGMGFNTITVYAHWALSEPEPMAFDFSAGKNISAFIELAWRKFGLHSICRVGPYITAETDFGGLPYWLSNVPGLELRRMNAHYLSYVDRYFDHLIPMLVPLQYNAYGGPILLFQVEDDTSTLSISVKENHDYYNYLVLAIRKRGITALTNTLCYPVPEECRRAAIPDTILAVEMPYWVPPVFSFDMVRLFYPRGPLIVMETYSGFFDLEGNPHQTLDGHVFATHMKRFLSAPGNASLSIYMAFGGSNFGFSNGAEHPVYLGDKQVIPYRADTTSYDYDAPIGEAGQIRSPKYFLLRNLLGPLNPSFNGSATPVPPSPAIASYGPIAMSEWAPLFSSLQSFRALQSASPIGMEKIPQGFGYVLYEGLIHQAHSPGAAFNVNGTIEDRALVHVMQERIKLARTNFFSLFFYHHHHLFALLLFLLTLSLFTHLPPFKMRGTVLILTLSSPFFYTDLPEGSPAMYNRR